MITRKVELDPDNHGAWRIINAQTGKPVVINLPKKEADDLHTQLVQTYSSNSL